MKRRRRAQSFVVKLFTKLFGQSLGSAVRDRGFEMNLLSVKDASIRQPHAAARSRTYKASKAAAKDSPLYAELVSALRNQGHSRPAARRTARMARGETFDARLRHALQIARGA